MPRAVLKPTALQMQKFLAAKPLLSEDSKAKLMDDHPIGADIFRDAPRGDGKPIIMDYLDKELSFRSAKEARAHRNKLIAEKKAFKEAVKNGTTTAKRYYPGRKSVLFDEERFPQLMFELRLLGINDAQIARVFQVSAPTVGLWRKKYPLFEQAYSMGGAAADAKVAAALYRRATGWSHKATKVHWDKEGQARTIDVIEHFPPDTAAATHWLNKRQARKWKDTKTTEFVGADGKPLGAPTIVINPIMSLPKEKPKTIEGTKTDRIFEVEE